MLNAKSGFLKTRDNVNIAFTHERAGHDALVIICPGFFNSMQNRWMRSVREIVCRKFDALIFDFRGHGQSSGKFYWLAREQADLEAVLAYARQAGYREINLIGFSLGAAISLITASHGHAISRMVMVSAPTSFWEINYHFWEPEMLSDLKDNFECDWEGKGARVGNMFLRKQKPITRLKYIPDIPIMFIHGTRDWIIKDDHSRKLYAAYPASASRKKLELIEDGLHAERLVQHFPGKMEALILGWFEKNNDGFRGDHRLG